MICDEVFPLLFLSWDLADVNNEFASDQIYLHNRIVVVFSRSFASETDIGQLLFFFVSAYIGPSDVLITIIRETTMKMQSSVSKLDASLRFLNAVFLSGNINCERPRLNRHSVTRCCKVRRCNHIPWLFAGLNFNRRFSANDEFSNFRKANMLICEKTRQSRVCPQENYSVD